MHFQTKFIDCYIVVKQNYAFWHIYNYNTHEIPWTTNYTEHWYLAMCNWRNRGIDSMTLVYNSMHLIFSTRQTYFVIAAYKI